MTNIPESVSEANHCMEVQPMPLTKLSYIILFPPGEQMLPNGSIVRNHDIAMESLKLLIDGGGVILPTGCGWAVQVINNDTGEVTTIGTLE